MVRAIILAAGRVSRMDGCTDALPKCLITLAGRRLLDRQIDSLSNGGVTEIGIVTGYAANYLSQEPLVRFHNDQWETTDMVTSLECANSWLDNSPCIVSYSDIFYDSSAIATLVRSADDLAITFDQKWLDQWQARFIDPLSDAETFKLNNSGYLTEIGKRTCDISEIQGQYMGLLRFTPTGWKAFLRAKSDFPTSQEASLHITAVLNRIIELGSVRIRAFPYSGVWGEIDTPDDLLLFQDRMS